MSKATHPLRTLVCPVCNGEFDTEKLNKKFCSTACQVASNRADTAAKREAARIPTGVCPGCGAEFERVGRQLFCSRRCATRMEARKRLGITDPGISGECWWCHTSFTRLHVWRVYCSPECAAFVKSLWGLSHRYGINRDDYREAWYAQGGLCAICRQPERTERNHLLSVDHDHVSGAFRGLLCSHCNRGTGLFGDDPACLRAAADYIERHRAAITI